MFIRVAKNPHRSQQRLGFLKYLTYRALQYDSNTIIGLGTDLLRVISKKVNIELNKSLETYIKYRLRGKFKNLLSDKQLKIFLEIQDIYLASSQIPSNTGKLYLSDCEKRYPYLLSSLGLTRERTNSLLVRGKVFLEFVLKKELDSFIDYNKSLNPFLLNDYQKYIFLYSILENDGDVIKPLYIQLLKLKDSFTDWIAGDFLPDIYFKIIKNYRSNVTSGIDKEKLDRLYDSAKRIERWVYKPRTGGRGAKLDAITPRLEPFVDLNLLIKKNPYKYEYYLSEQGKVFFKLFCSNESVDKFLGSSFFFALNKTFELKANPIKKDEIINVLFSAFNKIKSPLGYAPIKEIALLGAIKSLVNNRKYFEVYQATEIIMEYQKSHPYKVRFQMNRSGAPVYIKFLSNIKN